MRPFHPIPCTAVIALWLGLPMAASAGCPPARVNIRVAHQRAMLDVAIDGKPAHMVLDTGASQILLMGDAADRLGLPPADDHPPERRMSYGQAFQVRFVHARHVGFAGLTQDVADLPVAAGVVETGVDGFFTDDRLQEADIDVAEGFVDLGCDSAPAWTHEAGAVSLPLEDKPRPFGQAMINGRVVRVLFDTGSPVSSMTLAAARRSGVPVAGAPDGNASGVGTDMPLRAWTSHIAAISLGDRVARDVSIQVVDKPNASADVIAGFDFFLRHRVWIDRKGGRLVFQVLDGTELF